MKNEQLEICAAMQIHLTEHSEKKGKAQNMYLFIPLRLNYYKV